MCECCFKRKEMSSIKSKTFPQIRTDLFLSEVSILRISMLCIRVGNLKAITL